MGVINRKRILLVGINPEMLFDHVCLTTSRLDNELLSIIEGNFNGSRPIISNDGFEDKSIRNSISIECEGEILNDNIIYFEDINKPLLVYFPYYFDAIVINIESDIKIPSIDKMDLFEHQTVYFLSYYESWKTKSLKKFYGINTSNFITIDAIKTLTRTNRHETLVLEDMDSLSQEDLLHIMQYQWDTLKDELKVLQNRVSALETELKDKNESIDALNSIRKMLNNI
jgi:hypothetical protein